MIKPEELRGTLVLIRPQTIGLICSELLEQDQVMVKLPGNNIASFSVHEVYVLRDPEEIQKDALIDQTLLPYWEFNDIMAVAMFANSSRKENKTVAIEVSCKDPSVFGYTMATLAEELGLNRSYNLSR